MVRCWLVVISLVACGKGSPPNVEPPTAGSSAAGSGSATVVRTAGITAVFAGGWRTCALRDGELYCWGNNGDGALGPKVMTSQTNVPTVVPDLADVVEVASGESHVCARLRTGAVQCWGSNDDQQLGSLGVGSSKPVAIAIGNASQIAAAGHQTCAVVAGGVWCWGPGVPRDQGIKNIARVAVGEQHACALSTAGAVSCWGDNSKLQLGTVDVGKSLLALTVPLPSKVDEIAAGDHFTCARVGRSVWCWGAGDAAQLGNQDLAHSAKPREIEGVTDAVGLALGRDHACVRRASGAVDCWGGSDRGSFGYPPNCPRDRYAMTVSGSSHNSGVALSYCAAPMTVPGIADVAQLVHGASHACALDHHGRLSCWGDGGYGQLGNRSATYGSSKTPIEVQFASGVAQGPSRKAIDIATAGDWSCAVLAEQGGNVRCWGNGSLGQLGPSVKGRSATPVKMEIEDVVELAIGSYHACGRLASGGVRCWGYNDSGALGDGTTAKRSGLVAPQLPEVVQLSLSASSMTQHSCALGVDGRAWCWGANNQDQIKSGGGKGLPPTPIDGIGPATQVVAGHGASCAIVQGVPYCWGAVPSATGVAVAKPTPASGIDHVVELGMGAYGMCARKDDGSVVCWGKRRSGKPEPFTVPLAGKARAISVGLYGAAAILEDGSVQQWWIEEDGAPTTVEGARDIAQLSCSGSHCCALDQRGLASCWGSNANGQLGHPDAGTGGESKRALPVTL